jgi:hypothetical protein
VRKVSKLIEGIFIAILMAALFGACYLISDLLGLRIIVENVNNYSVKLVIII